MSLDDLFKSEGFLLLLLIGGAIYMIFMLIAVWGKTASVKAANDSLPIERKSAIIVSKEAIPNTLKFRIIFECDDTKRVSLVVDHSIASTWIVGDKGILSCQGTRYISFSKGGE